MSDYKKYIALIMLVVATAAVNAEKSKVKASPNGILFPDDYTSWTPVGVSHRTDKPSLRLILANPIAKNAVDAGTTNPWPDGAMLAKIVWKDRLHKDWKPATIPGKLVHAEFMFKDRIKFKKTGGWGFARWLGKNKKPFGNVRSAQECYQCHLKAKKSDIVFTRPISLP